MLPVRLGYRDRMSVPERPEDSAGEPERDWDAEFEGLKQQLGGSREVHLISDTPVIGGGRGPRDYSPPEVAEDEHWVPEEPGPATGSTMTRLAWLGIAGGPLLMLLAALAFRRAPVWYLTLCLLIFVAGCVIGFLQLPQRRRDAGDDGAQV